MCGRYTQTKGPYDIRLQVKIDDFLREITPRYNIAPGQRAPVIVHDGRISVKLMQWGLVPSWAKDPAIGNRMINARAETLTEKPSFKRLVGKRRCLVLTDGFYEWRREGKRKVPMRFVLKSREPFGFAGLWDSWRKPDGNELQSYTIITTQANELLKPIHDRMPVILDNPAQMAWLDPDVTEPKIVTALLQPFPSELMEGYDVSTLVNSPANDRPECIEALE